MHKFSADILFPVSAPPIPNGVVITDETGKILALESREQHDPASLDIRRGAIVPGFINTHCHLELSHMKGKVDTGTGLLPFLKSVVQFRNVPEEEIQDAIRRADADMYAAGIVAVGDISNKLDTAAVKDQSRIRYYTFVEMFDFLQDSRAEQTFNQYLPVWEGQSTAHGNRKSAVPHAPYTVSKELFRRIAALNADDATVSIHNQETPHEDELFQTKTGGFMEFYNMFQIPLTEFEAGGRNSIHYALENMNPQQRNLFVHNTMCGPDDLQAAQSWSERVFWATCPNANLYIENRLPYYRYFLDAGSHDHRHRQPHVELATLGAGGNENHRAVPVVCILRNAAAMGHAQRRPRTRFRGRSGQHRSGQNAGDQFARHRQRPEIAGRHECHEIGLTRPKN
jgi:cytosine/adenosine deaminase-related metal-dependent hydrolase